VDFALIDRDGKAAQNLGIALGGLRMEVFYSE
jgi:hypothetical protein